MILRRHLNSLLPIFVLVITQLHLLRNLTSLYFVCYLLSFTGAVWFLLNRWYLLSTAEKKSIWFILAMFIYPIFTFLPGVLAGEYEGFGSIAVGVSRLLFSLPIYLAIIASPSDKESINKLLVTTAIITFIAALSIPYQFIFGPVMWFADSAERAGFARYASLFGSLTALGIVCGYGLLAAILSIRNSFWKVTVVSGIVMGSILSLQKAAIANMILCIAILPLIKKVKIKRVVYPVILFILIFGAAGSYFGDELSGFTSSVRIFSDSDSSFADDVSVSESIMERLIELPLGALNYHGFKSLIVGIGPIGGSGAFGYPDVPMSHNGIVDLFLVGGIIYFVLFLALVAFVAIIAARGKPQAEVAYLVYFGTFAFFIQLLNMPFSGLIFFAPSNALFFAVALKCILLKRQK
jgi:hypothetical protein